MISLHSVPKRLEGAKLYGWTQVRAAEWMLPRPPGAAPQSRTAFLGCVSLDEGFFFFYSPSPILVYMENPYGCNKWQ